jgi:hypothetical protein
MRCCHKCPSVAPVQRPLFFPDLNETLIFSAYFRKTLRYQIQWKSVQLFLADGRKLIVVFRNFATVPDNMPCYYTFAHHTFVECCCKTLTLRSCYSRERRSSIIDVLLYTAAVLCRGMNKVMVTSHCSITVLGRLSVGVTVFT